MSGFDLMRSVGRRISWLYEGEVQGNLIRDPLTIKPLDAAATDRRP
jgi:hypothetical protein